MKKEAMLYEKAPRGEAHCFLCSHYCKIKESKYGICGVRKNEKSRLYTYAYGEVIASHVDPIEKKPLYHFFPGSYAYSVATKGCNFRCGFCQNWQISQVSYADGHTGGRALSSCEIVKEAKKHQCKSIAYTYTEPTIFFEYAYDTAKIAKVEGLLNIFVTNGYMTRKALETIRPYLDAANVDLKSSSEDTYRKVCGGSLKPVLESIRCMKELGIWVEVTTLVVPGMNDTDDELKSIAGYIAGIGRDIPWHISRFHPDYKFTGPMPTAAGTLKNAESIGKQAGLKYIYLGNIGEETNTFCNNCGKLLVVRKGRLKCENSIKADKCPECNTQIEGVWHT